MLRNFHQKSRTFLIAVAALTSLGGSERLEQLRGALPEGAFYIASGEQIIRRVDMTGAGD